MPREVGNGQVRVLSVFPGPGKITPHPAHYFDKDIAPVSKSTLERKELLTYFVIFAVALGLRLLLVVVWHTDDFARFESGDYILYRLGAEHFLEQGDFTNSLFLARPPMVPLMIALLNVDTLAVLLANCVLGALTVPLTMLLARELGCDPTVTLIAGLLLAVDASGVVYSAFLGSESLANLLLVGSWLAMIHMTRVQPRRAIVWGVVAGALLVGSALARPASYLLWTGLGVWLLLQFRRHWLAIGAFMLVAALGVGGWMAHNGQVFGHTTFSTVGPYTMVYYHAASVEHLASGDEMDAVYIRINERMETLLGRDPEGVDAGYMHHYLASTPEIDAALAQVAREIMLAHPIYTAITLPVGFVRMYGLLPGRVAFARDQLLVALPQVVWNGALLLGTCYGLWIAFRRRDWLLFWWAGLNGAYFTVGLVLVKSVGDVRERMSILPIMVILTAITIRDLWQRRARRTLTKS